MPHIVIEYSANLEPDIDPMRLVSAVHRAALSQPIFDAHGARTRAARREHFLIADGDPTHAFIAVTARIGPGRSLPERKQASETIMAALFAEIAAIYQQRGLILSVEVTELDGGAMTRRNGLRERASA